MTMKEMTIKIGGMSCQHCVKAVKKTLQELDGVNHLEVKIGEAAISFDNNKLTVKDIEKAIVDSGYKVES
jgi:copper chaperone